MSSTTTTQLPPGIYRIVVGGRSASQPKQLLTNRENYITILPPSADNDPQQEWRIEHSKDDTFVISDASPIFPYLYLTYRGAPEKPKARNSVVVQPERVPSKFPPTKWIVSFNPQSRASIQVDGSDLGISISSARIYPPFLELNDKNQLEWRLEFVRKD